MKTPEERAFAIVHEWALYTKHDFEEKLESMIRRRPPRSRGRGTGALREDCRVECVRSRHSMGPRRSLQRDQDRPEDPRPCPRRTKPRRPRRGRWGVRWKWISVDGVVAIFKRIGWSFEVLPLFGGKSWFVAILRTCRAHERKDEEREDG